MFNNKKIKILIQNVDIPNRGNQALTLATIDTIKEFIPEAEFSLMGRKGGNLRDFQIKKAIGYRPDYSNETTRKIIYYMYYVIISGYYLIICILINIFHRFNIKFKINKNSPLFNYYYCDAFVDIGGDSLSGEYGSAVLSILVNFLYGILLNKPIILYGASLGYFKSSVINFFIKSILNHTQLILLRESKSKKYLDDNNITRPKICVTADPAFLLKPVSDPEISKILSDEDIELLKPVIGINASGMISGFRNADKEDLVTVFSNTIDYLIDKYDMNILLVPHVFDALYDDRTMISNIYAKIKNESHVNIVKNEYSSQELKGLISKCELFVGSRMHATIASTSLFIPTVGLAYSHKMKGVIGEKLGQEEYILDINEVDSRLLQSKISDAWNNREKIKKELEIKIPDMKEKAMLNGILVKELLESNLKN